jgi:DNA-directed RNA polymerase subunit RPC12/RpoP
VTEKDERPFIKITLDYLDNPKIDALSDSGIILHLSLILKAGHQQRDGLVSSRLCVARGAGPLEELVTGGLLARIDELTYQLLDIGDFLKLRGDGDIWRSPLTVRRAQIPLALRLEIYARDGYQCVTCGSIVDLSLDHIHPWSLGGSDERENLQTMCRPCNSRKGAKVVEGHPAVLHGHKRTIPPPQMDRATQ